MARRSRCLSLSLSVIPLLVCLQIFVSDSFVCSGFVAFLFWDLFIKPICASRSHVRPGFCLLWLSVSVLACMGVLALHRVGFVSFSVGLACVECKFLAIDKHNNWGHTPARPSARRICPLHASVRPSRLSARPVCEPDSSGPFRSVQSPDSSTRPMHPPDHPLCNNSHVPLVTRARKALMSWWWCSHIGCSWCWCWSKVKYKKQQMLCAWAWRAPLVYDCLAIYDDGHYIEIQQGVTLAITWCSRYNMIQHQVRALTLSGTFCKQRIINHTYLSLRAATWVAQATYHLVIKIWEAPWAPKPIKHKIF